MNKTHTCAVCGSNLTVPLRAGFDQWFWRRMTGLDPKQRPQDIELNHCQICSSGSVNYRFTPEQERNYYQNYMTGEYLESRGLEKYAGEFYSERTYQQRKQCLQAHIERKIPLEDVKSALDFGGHRGELFPDRLAHADLAVLEVDDQQTLLPGVRSIKFDSQEQFDFVMSQHTLEHVSDVVGVFRQIINFTRPGGWIYVEVPAEDLVRWREPYQFHEHINLFSPQGLERLFEQHNIQHWGAVQLNMPNIVGTCWAIIGRRNEQVL